MRKIILTLVTFVALSIAGALVSGQDTAHATNQTITCGLSGTCKGETFGYITFGSTWSAFGTADPLHPTQHYFAWTRGTNRYHIGQVWEESAKNCYNSSSKCIAPEEDYCDTAGYPAGCGTSHTYWYATTWSYFKTPTVYSVFTATSASRANSSCWNSMSCI